MTNKNKTVTIVEIHPDTGEEWETITELNEEGEVVSISID